MDITKISKNIQSDLIKSLENTYPAIFTIVKEIDKSGGQALLVGGAVRDLFLGLDIKDVDIEVHKLNAEKLESILKQFGPVSLVGKTFGVFKIHGTDTDWSLPRKDAQGRKPEVAIDPYMGYKEAFSRRDLTINAMGIDLITYDLIDPFNGLKDLKEGVLSTPDKDKFLQDPLRFYRVMQFISRFDMLPDEKLTHICENMDISHVSVERIEQEFEKMILRSKRPSRGIRWLKSISRLSEVLPELFAVVGVGQEASWHPEGEVFEHAMQCIDAAAVMGYDNNKEKLIVVYAALCHDLGKAITTQEIGGQFKSIGHAKEGVKLSKKLLSRITKNKDLIEAVAKLVRYHMSPVQFIAAKSKPAAYKRLAKKLAPEATMDMLAKVALADKRGRNPLKGSPLRKNFPAIEKFLKIAREAKVEKIPEPPVLLGRDLMEEVEPGPKMGELLKQAYEIQIERGVRDKQELKEIILREFLNKGDAGR
ncbi:CCA tRNA nucleotidyltransferase [Candidatus Dependentiae bacterium]